MNVDERYSMIDPSGSRIHFTEIQKECIDYGGKSTFVTKGTAGSGKSLTMIKRAMERRKEIIEKNLKNRVMIFTYNKTLSNGIRYILETNGVESTDNILHVEHVDSNLARICRDLKLIPKKSKNYSNKGRYNPHFKKRRYRSGEFEPISEESQIATIKEVLEKFSKEDDHRFFKLEPKFWIDEILWMYHNGIADHNDENRYLNMSRRGRCKTYRVRMTQTERRVAFRIFIEYNDSIFYKEFIEWDRVYALLYRDHIDHISDRYKYDYVFIDEAQDLTLVKMQIVSKLCKNELEIAMDKNQSLYGHRWRFIDSIGSVPYVKTLHMMHRGTKEIDKFSRDLKKIDDSLLDEEDRYEYELSPISRNVLPKIVKCSSRSNEINFIVNEIKVLSQNQKTSIAILCLTYDDLNKFNKKLREKGIEAEFFRNEEFTALKPGVKLITVYSAKGLGFGYVFVPFFEENVYPPSIESIINSLELAELNEDVQTVIKEAISEESAEFRRLAYVAITRAMGNVYLTYSGNPSPFIKEFDTSHYVLVDESGRRTTDPRIHEIRPEYSRVTIRPKPRSPYDYECYDESPGEKIGKSSLFKKWMGFAKNKNDGESISRHKPAQRTTPIQKPRVSPESGTVAINAPRQRIVTRAEQEFEYAEESPRGKLVSILQSADAEHIDLGPKAPIWIIDGPGVASLIEHLENMDYSFKHSPNGNRSTQNRAAYYIWLK